MRKINIQAANSKAFFSYSCFCISFISIFLLLLSLSSSTNKKFDLIVVAVEDEIGFELDSSEIDMADLS